jgi:hypothetical protein
MRLEAGGLCGRVSVSLGGRVILAVLRALDSQGKGRANDRMKFRLALPMRHQAALQTMLRVALPMTHPAALPITLPAALPMTHPAALPITLRVALPEGGIRAGTHKANKQNVPICSDKK